MFLIIYFLNTSRNGLTLNQTLRNPLKLPYHPLANSSQSQKPIPQLGQTVPF
ncbi:uncharacterized protein METZ01_LOCUS369854 [marine metagenome]|uniref:Uncharacterized protein n=1 Tax=marine metagenome TaxID=408172 RepID=A0A382T4A4_9ZZZZ